MKYAQYQTQLQIRYTIYNGFYVAGPVASIVQIALQIERRYSKNNYFLLQGTFHITLQIILLCHHFWCFINDIFINKLADFIFWMETKVW